MKKNYLAVVIAALTFSLAACDSSGNETPKAAEKPAAAQAESATHVETSSSTSVSTISEDMKKVSYAIGYQFGKNLSATGITTIDKAEMSSGFDDAMSGKQPKLTQEETQAAMTTIEAEVQKNVAAEAKAYEEKGKTFLAENAKRNGVITTKSGLQYEVVQKGKGAKPTETDIVKVNYEGALVDGKVFDSSIQRGEPIEFAVSSVIPGWKEALQQMQVGEKAKLYIPSELAYGASGVPPVIPANSVLIFDVELLDIKKPENKAKTADKPAAQQSSKK